MTDLTPTEEEDAASKVVRLTDQQWAEICDLYETDKAGITDLAARFGVSRQNLSKRFKTEGIIRGSRVPGANAEPDVERFADKRGAWIETTKVTGYKSLVQANMLNRKIMADGVKAGKSMETIDGELMAVQRYNKILVDNLKATLELLDAANFVDAEDLPELHIEDLTQEEILQHHKDTGAIPEDATIEDMIQEAIDLGEVFH